MNREVLSSAYARLRGIRNVLYQSRSGAVVRSIGYDLNKIVTSLQNIIGEDAADFQLSTRVLTQYKSSELVDREEALNKTEQLISYLEYKFHINENIIEIGSIYNSIKDEELKSRCADLLSVPGNFDRVINQATQVLEMRLKKLTQDNEGLTGAGLVNAYIRADPAKSVVELSSDKGEQEGYANLLRGMMGAFRNPSHHKFLEHIDREHALQICAFIDNLLLVLGQAKIDLNRK